MVMKIKVVIILVWAIIVSCGSMRVPIAYTGDIQPAHWLRDTIVSHEQSGKQIRIPVQLYFPAKYKRGDSLRTLIVLHGFKQSYLDWERYTEIEKYADRYGFILVCPDMSTTLYESRYYPETKNKWSPVPGGKFIIEILMPYLKDNFSIAADRNSTGIVGLSTGGRGAILLAAQRVDLFGSAAGLSGDYDPELMKNDPLLISVYGPYDRHEKRWKEEDNIIALAEKLKNTPVYIAHGAKDTVVPNEQSIMLVLRIKRLREINGGGYPLKLETAISAKGLHDWKFWGDCVPDFMEFFNNQLKK